MWPVLGPPEWHALEAVAREGAAALDEEGVRRAVDGFDGTVRASVRLRGELADMRAIEDLPQTLASAFAAAADTFGDLADLMYRTRNRISDVVDRAAQRIEAVSGTDDAERARGPISAIVVSARTEVIDVVTDATAQVNLAGLPKLRRIAELLGPTMPDVPADVSGPRAAVSEASSAPVSGVLDTEPASRTGPAVSGPSTAVAGSNMSNHQVPQGGSPTIAPWAGVPDGSGSQPTTLHSPPSPSAGGTPTGDESLTSGGSMTGQPGDSASQDTVLGPVAVTATSSRITAAGALENPEHSNAAENTAVESVPLSPGAAMVPVAPTAPASGQQPSVAGNRYPKTAISPRVEATPSTATSPGTMAQRPGLSPSPAAVPAVTAPEGRKGRPPVALPPDAPDNANTPGSSAETQDSLGDVVRAAMIQATGSAHLIGARVDGDLVLARSLLAGILKVAPPPADWAVATMRHAGGLSVYVTSNEGAGYLPAGLYLPPEVSRPWGWKLPEEVIWEGISDPARVLAEFGSVWGLRSGARLTAIASSATVAPGLRRELPDLPLEGEVVAAAGLDLSAPRSGRVDRLELTTTAAVVRRIAVVPETAIADRCGLMARAAHVGSLAEAADRAMTMEPPVLRERILRGWQNGGAVDEQSWQDLRDVDDLLAAAMLAEQVDVARIPLGELRADSAGGRADLARLRRIVLERRCDELVLGLAAAPTRQCLRDAVYAYAQIARRRPGPGAPWVGPAPAPAAAPPPHARGVEDPRALGRGPALTHFPLSARRGRGRGRFAAPPHRPRPTGRH
ncbi:hypothetical protein [Nocardia brasiliensis]|uniref:hypothetical protein n=1 Tax=Nocardia brasiliensis TaxID=37326 RepID=UPI002458F2B8|nr:hypothetical protein [Nocardia brasiliensis]